MRNTKKVLLIVGIAVLVIALGVGGCLLLLGGNEATTPATTGAAPTTAPAGSATYRIEVTNTSGVPLQDVGLEIYYDTTELVAVLKTDENGKAEFTDKLRDNYIAVIDNAPTGYAVEESYPLTGEVTKIVLETGNMDEIDPNQLKYKLGDPMMDFTVTGPDGADYTFSELLRDKKAVLLFFYENDSAACTADLAQLQVAYDLYKDSVSVLALNPRGTEDAAVKALQQELGLTFPTANCGPEWESILSVTEYPTTVVVDRFGNICLMHNGAAPTAKTFEDLCVYFSAETYEAKLITEITEIISEAEAGSPENPTEISGVNSFEVTVEPGKIYYCDVYKAFNMYMQIKSENASVIYNGQTYNAKNGVVGLMVSSPDTFTPAKIGFGNNGTKTETFTVTLGALQGSFDNPYTMEMGKVEVRIAAGNEQGVFYTYVPNEDGTLKMTCTGVTSGVKYSYFLFNTVTSAMRNLESDGQTDENGMPVLEVQAKKGQKIQICVSTLPDSNNAYPAATFTFDALFTAGEVEDAEKVEETEYTVTVLDTNNQPMTNVSVVVDVAGVATAFSTDQTGKAIFRLPSGTYTGTVYVPDGYTAANTAFSLTVEVPTAAVTVEKILRSDYTVTVLDPEGKAVPNVLVRIGSGAWLTTDEAGKVTSNLETDSYTVMVMIPGGFSGASTYTFASGVTEMTVTLGYAPGSEKNPIPVTEYPFTTDRLDAGQELWYAFTASEGMTGIKISDADACIRVDGTTIPANSDGIVEYTFSGTAVLAIGNAGTARESYKAEAMYPLGTEQNPIVIRSYPAQTPAMAAGQSLYFRFEQAEKVLGFTVADGDIRVTYVETEYAPESGVLTYAFPEANTVLMIRNAGTEEKTFTFEAVIPEEGTEESPEVLTALGNVTRKLETGDADGYYYTYTTGKSGTLTLRLLQNISVEYDVELYTNSRYSLMSEGTTARQVTIDMAAGETVTIHLFVLAEGYPTANFRMRLSFAEGEVLPPTDPDAPPTDPENPPTDEPEDPVTPPVVPPTEPEGAYTYTVTVTDIFGAGQKNIGVMFMKDGVPEKVLNTDADGKAVLGTDQEGSYTVELVFTGKEYYYDKAAAVLTPENKNLTIKLVANMDESDSEPLYILNDNPAYNLYVGGTRVKLGMGKPNFSAEYENNCYFLFTPKTAGTYQISVSPTVALSLWGTTSFVSPWTDMVVDNVVTFSISEGSVGFTTYVIGLKGDTEITDVVVNIARIGDPEFSIADQPWTEWETGTKPNANWKNEVGLVDQGGAYYTLSGKPTYVDINAATGSYTLYYDEAKGYYRLGKDGPAVLVDLNVQRFVPLYERVNGNGQYGGSAVTRYFFDSTGKFLRKENYTEYIQGCFTEVNLDSNNESGYYVLTKDMMYVLQNGFAQWWDPTSDNYMEGFATANPEYAWMFACCYVE